MPAVAEFLAGGWQLNAVVQRQSGPPLGFGDVWTLFTGDPDNIVLPKSQRSVDRWFNNFRVNGKLKTQFRAECSNAWNHPNPFSDNHANHHHVRNDHQPRCATNPATGIARTILSSGDHEVTKGFVTRTPRISWPSFRPSLYRMDAPL